MRRKDCERADFMVERGQDFDDDDVDLHAQPEASLDAGVEASLEVQMWGCQTVRKVLLPDAISLHREMMVFLFLSSSVCTPALPCPSLPQAWGSASL